MNLLRLALPAVVLLYFCGRSLRQRIFLLGIPFILYMGPSLFADGFKPLWVPARLTDPSDHVMIWLVVVWVLTFDLLLPGRDRRAGERRLFGPRLSVPEEFAIIVLAAYVGLEVMLTLIRYGDVLATLSEAKPFLYLFAGYFLLRGVFFRASRDDTLAFIETLVLINTVAAGLFIVHQGLHVQVYAETEYQTFTFMGQTITRSFYFMPQLLMLAIAYCLVRRSWGVLWLAVFVVSLAAIWVSYTRSLFLIAVAEVLVVLGVRLLKVREAGPAMRRGLAIVGIVVVFAVAAFAAMPTQSRYLLSRFSQVSAAGSVADEPNLKNRQDKVRQVYEWLATSSRTTGAGFVSVTADGHVASARWMTSDLVWVMVLFRLGLVGVVLVLAIYGTAAWRALHLAIYEVGDAEVLALLLLAVLAGAFLESFVSWVFLNPARYPMGLWPFALLAAEACRRRAELALASDVD